MVCLLNRFFGYDLEVTPQHKLVCTAYPSVRIAADIYQDGPCYLAILSVDGVPVLKESLIENIKKYADVDLMHAPFVEFLLEYASV